MTKGYGDVSDLEQGPTSHEPGDLPAAPGEAFVLAPVEILSSEGGVLQPAPRRRRTGLIAGIATVAVLAMAAGSLAAWSALSGGGAQPEDVLPASTIAFAKVDLDPSAGQKIQLYNLLQKFPASSQLKDTDKDFGQWLVRRLTESAATSNGVDFARDIEPWLGRRFAVAAVPGPSSDEPVEPLVILQETDEKAAAAALDKIRKADGADKLDYAFQDGYVVVATSSSTAAHAAVAAALQAPLGKDTRFVDDVASLQSDQVVTAWADAGAVGRLVKAEAGKLDAVPGGQLGQLVDATYQGRWVLGIHAADSTVEMVVNTRGGKPSAAVAPVSGVAHVAPDAWGVLAIGGMDQRVDDLWKQVSALPTYKDMVAKATDQLGLDLPGDLKTLLGSELELSIGGDILDSPTFVAAATSKDAATAAAAKARLAAILDSAGAPPDLLAARVDGSTLYVGSSQDAVDGAGDGKLAANPLFAQAVADPGSAEVLAFFDLSGVWKSLESGVLDGSDNKEFEHLAAVGFSGRHSGGDSSFTLRIVLR